MSKPKLTLVVQPQDYFRELVVNAMQRQSIATKPETEFYLVNMLNQFMTTDRLYEKDADGSNKEEALALMIQQALETQPARAQAVMFRRIGDVSLYKAGFFQDSFNRKLVDVDYYIELGGTAYQHVASRSPEEELRALYRELADKFSAFVDVLADVCDHTINRGDTEKDILRLYELWVRTKSDRAAKALKEAGIVPNVNFKKDWQ